MIKLLSKKCLASLFNCKNLLDCNFLDPINDETWARMVKQTYKHLMAIDEHKYIYPRFSEILQTFVYYVCNKLVRHHPSLTYLHCHVFLGSL